MDCCVLHFFAWKTEHFEGKNADLSPGYKFDKTFLNKLSSFLGYMYMPVSNPQAMSEWLLSGKMNNGALNLYNYTTQSYLHHN
jgi:hypothetical protein